MLDLLLEVGDRVRSAWDDVLIFWKRSIIIRIFYIIMMISQHPTPPLYRIQIGTPLTLLDKQYKTNPTLLTFSSPVGFFVLNIVLSGSNFANFCLGIGAMARLAAVWGRHRINLNIF
jgi:hypothetical protein